jgi:hypothetical protein
MVNLMIITSASQRLLELEIGTTCILKDLANDDGHSPRVVISFPVLHDTNEQVSISFSGNDLYELTEIIDAAKLVKGRIV